MSKTACTREIIEYLEAYEKIHGIGAVESIGTVCSGNRDVEYIFDIEDRNGVQTHVEIPTLKKESLWSDTEVKLQLPGFYMWELYETLKREREVCEKQNNTARIDLLDVIIQELKPLADKFVEDNYVLVLPERMITLTDGTCMGDIIIVFSTNAPVEELKALEKISNDVYINGGEAEDVPIWTDVLKEKGYIFEYLDEHQHITPMGTSKEWLEEKYPSIKEHYLIQNQPKCTNIKRRTYIG